MNQTVTINISGLVFHIEVDAYEELKNYLNKIKSYFRDSQEREEIMADIEARIAELFNNKISDVNQVILMKDVEEVIVIMGKPEQYLTEDEEEVKEETSNNYSQGKTNNSGKKLFRNPDERVIGGVCSGTADYFGFDTVWMRLAFILSTIFLGFGPMLYIILWMVVPEAQTASEKLQMKGEPINFENIGKKVEEEANKVNDKLKNVNTNSFGQFLEKAFATIGTVLQAIFKVAGKVIGLALLMLGLFLGVWLVIGLFDDSIVLSYTSTGISAIESGELVELLFSSHDHYIIFLVSAIIVAILPILGLIYGGIKLLFKIKGNPAVSISLAILWFIAFFSALTIGLTTASDHKADQKFVEEKVISKLNDIIYIKSNNNVVPGEMMFEVDDFTLAIDDDFFYSTEVEMTIEPSDSDSIEMITTYRSHGKTKKDATKKIKQISYNVEQQDSNLLFKSYFKAPKEDRLRGQEVRVVLKLPVGQGVYLDKSMKQIVYNIENVSNTWDDDMMGKKWIMLKEGLTCLDCPNIEGINTNEISDYLLNEDEEEVTEE